MTEKVFVNNFKKYLQIFVTFTAMADHKLYDRYWWAQWLRSFEQGEKVTVRPDKAHIRSIRVAAARMREHGYYFICTTKQGELCVERTTLEQWMARPTRRWM